MESAESSQFWVLIPAAGSGSRSGASIPKQYLELGGRCVIEWSVHCFLQLREVRGLVVAVAAGDESFARLACARDPRVSTCQGGASRADSVLAGLRHLQTRGAEPQDWVMVHDAARPGISAEAVLRLRAQAHDPAQTGQNPDSGAILALPVADTLKQATRSAPQRIKATVSRQQLWQAQTPQYFRLQPLRHALEAALAEGVEITDEASAMEHAGHQPLLVPGEARNFKITWPGDLQRAERWLVADGRAAGTQHRTGTSPS